MTALEVYIDRTEQCTCCRELYLWVLLTVQINHQNRVLILCSLCKEKTGA